MKQPILRYKTHKPDWGVKGCAVIMFAGGLLIILSAPLIGLAFLVLGVFPFVMFEFIEFDLHKNLYRKGISIAGDRKSVV